MGDEETKNILTDTVTDADPDAMAYDDAFRTMISDSCILAVSLLNEMFGMEIPLDAKLTNLQNEVYILSEKKRITDSRIRVESPEGEGKERYNGVYHAECESTAGGSAILFRLFEYDSADALRRSKLEGDTLYLEYSRTGVLFLRDTKNTPDEMHMVIKSPDSEDSLTINVAVMKLSSYTLADIYDNKLWFLLPFYVFNYEKGLKSKDAQKAKTTEDEILTVVRDIRNKIELLADAGEIDDYTITLIEDMISKVTAKMAYKHEKVRKGVDEIMGGRVLEHRAKTIYESGEREGISLGEKLGQDKLATAIRELKSGKSEADLRNNGVDDATIKIALTCL